ncbi:MAG: D-alanyl-D-alanine carboxypeptidase/D-alanyl-D-alanine-endopeptidase (penicillin-binding protein 4) [Paracoccaceae bacterium]|jgi:D-alanyl-D-alanine carboxypeptidase/D-alanyl-D-alanine-endopeptidase (penicillin-binding protein 4)
MRNGKPPARVDAGIGALIKAAGISGVVACSVADVETGRVLEAVNGKTGLPPASVAKALTTLYALEVLGPEYQFATRIITTGSVSNGILTGDVILAGGGDPTLTTDDLALLAAGLKSVGVREVRGAFRVYDGFLPYVHSIDAQQPDQLGYSPAVSGIALNYNRVHFEWKRGTSGYAVTMDARTKRYRPAVQMARMKVVNRRVPVYTYADRKGADQWTVASQALGNKGARWLPVRKPGLYAGDVFRTLARAQGIVLKAPKVDSSLSENAQTVVQHDSAALHVIIKGMLKYSNNLTAEMVGMTASAVQGGKPASLEASAAQMSRWAGQRFGMTGTKMVDHSGLGGASRMTPNDLVKALIQVRKRGVLRPLLKPFAMRDSKRRVIKSHPIKVDAKTGTLNFVSGLAGFMTAADGTELAFAIFTADTAIRSRIKRADREVPQGARAWNRKAKKLQQALIDRWGARYGS